MKLKGKTVAITGVSGFVGSQAVERFLSKGAEVRGLVRTPLDDPAITEIEGGINAENAVKTLIQGADVVLHCAASSGPTFQEAREVNVEGTRTLGESALDAGCKRFIHISTCGAYDLVDADVVTEETPLWEYDENSKLAYGVTKAEAERVLMQLHEKGLPVSILRPPNILGAHPRSTWSHKVGKWVHSGEATIPGDGSNSWPYVHIHNLLDAMEAVLERPKSVGEAYTIVDGHTTWGQFLNAIADWMDAELIEVEKESPYDFFYGEFSTRKAREELGYQPTVDYKTALQETKEYLQEAGYLT